MDVMIHKTNIAGAFKCLKIKFKQVVENKKIFQSLIHVMVSICVPSLHWAWAWWVLYDVVLVMVYLVGQMIVQRTVLLCLVAEMIEQKAVVVSFVVEMIEQKALVVGLVANMIEQKALLLGLVAQMI